MPELNCYNKGCGKKFDPTKNEEDSCKYHPGPPYFHDAYKIWKCCDKKFTDFGTFLSHPGCTLGKHSNEKVEDIVRLSATKEIRPEKQEEVIVWSGLNKPSERSLASGRMQNLTKEITPGASAAVEKYLATVKEKENNGEIPIGAACVNNSCKTTYNGPETNSTACVHHPGVAIFHEGMKYWSCCKRKTSDFSSFLSQEGCTTGEHKWSKNERVDKIREDWFSRLGYIHLNVYCKGSIGDQCVFETDGLTLRTTIVHGFGDKITDKNYDLFGAIVPEESKIIIGERKIEMVLKQAEPLGWPKLVYSPEENQQESVQS
jgi:cysteine/histidine-rich domain-containing protein 1